MNTQYPAGTGFDPRFQRPNGINVGGIGNLYAPQPQPEEEQGINPLALLGGLAAAGAAAVGGYYGSRRLGMWGKGTPGAATAERPVTPSPNPPSSPGSVKQAPRQQWTGSSEDKSRYYRENQGPVVAQNTEVPDHYYKGDSKETYTRRMPIARNQQFGNLLARYADGLSGNAPIKKEFSEDLRSIAEEILEEQGYKKAYAPTEIGANTGSLSLAEQRAYLAELEKSKTDIGAIGNLTRDLNPPAPTLTDVEAAPKAAQQEVVDAVAPGPTTLTDVEKIKEKYKDQATRANNFRKQFIADQERVGPLYDANEVIIEGMSPQELAALRGQDPRAVKPKAPSPAENYEYPSVVTTTTLRSAEPTGFRAGGRINVGGRDFNILETDSEQSLLYLQDPDSKQPTAVRMIGLKDAAPEDIDVDVSRFFVDDTANEILSRNAAEAARNRRGQSFAAQISETLGIPIEESRRAIAIGKRKNRARKQENMVLSAQELLADPAKVAAYLEEPEYISAEDEAFYANTIGRYRDIQNENRRQANVEANADRSERLPILPYPIDKLGPVGIDKTVVLRKDLPAPIELKVVHINPDKGTFLARNPKSGLARQFQTVLPGETFEGGTVPSAAVRALADRANKADIFRQKIYRDLESTGEFDQAESIGPRYEGFETIGKEGPTPTIAEYPKAVLEPLTFKTHSQRKNKEVKLLHPFAALNAGLSGGFNISDVDLMDLQQITKRVADNPSALSTLSSHEKHVLERATSAVMEVSADAAQSTIVTTLLTGELALPDTKGLSWDTRDPSRTIVQAYSPRTQVSTVGRSRAAKPGISSFAGYYRNPFDGTLGRAGDFGLSNDPSDYGGIGKQMAPFLAGYEPRQPNLEMTTSVGSGKTRASAEDEINFVLGVSPEDSTSNSPRRDPKPYKARTFLDLLQRSRQGQKTLDLEDGYYRYEGVVGTDRGYKPIPLIDESAAGLLGVLGTQVKLDKNGNPYIKSDSKITDQSLDNAIIARRREINRKGKRVDRSLGDDGNPIRYAPGGLSDGSNNSPIGVELKTDLTENKLSREDREVAAQLGVMLASSDLDLTPEQLEFKQGLLALAPGDRDQALIKAAALVRSGNRAKAAANQIGMAADRRVQSARTDGISLRDFVPKSGNLTDDDINELPDNLRKQILNEIPNIQRLAAEGKLSAEEAQSQMGQTALSRAINNILGGIKIGKDGTLPGTGLSARQIAEVQAKIGQESPLVELRGSDRIRTEGRKKQTAIQQVHEALTLEQQKPPSSTAGQGMGRNYDDLPQHKSAAKLDAEQKGAMQRFAERKLRTRTSAVDTINEALAEKAAAITEAETDILTRNRNNTAGGSMLDRLVRIIQDKPIEEPLPDEFFQKQPVYVTQRNEQGDLVQVPKLDKNGRQIKRTYASDDVYAAIQKLNETEASLAGLEIDPSQLVPAGVDKRGNPTYTRNQGDIPNYSRPFAHKIEDDWVKDPETRAVRDAYLLSDAPGLRLSGREGDINLGMTYSDLEDDVQIRKVVDRSVPAPEKGRRPKTKEVGGWPVSWTPEAAYDYTENVPIKSKWEEEARSNPKGIFAEVNRINAEIDQRNAQRTANPTGIREYDELEERINPTQLQEQIKQNPGAYSSELVRDAARTLPEDREWQGRGMDQNPLLAATTLEVMDKMGLGRPKEIEEYVDVMKLKGTQYSGNSAPKLLGAMMYQTLIGQQGKAASKAKIIPPDRPEDPNNPLSKSYQSTKDGMGRFARTSNPNEYLQRELGITRGTPNDPIDPSMSKEEAIEKALGMGIIPASVAEKMRSDERITSELLQTRYWELRPGSSIDPSYRIPEQMAEVVRRGLMSAEDADLLEKQLLKEDQRVRPAYRPMILRTKAEQAAPVRINIPRPVRGVKARATGTTDENIFANETGTVTAADIATLNAKLRGGTIPKPKSNKATARPGSPSYGEPVRQVPVYASESGEVPSAEFRREGDVEMDRVGPNAPNPTRLDRGDRIRFGKERRAIQKTASRAEAAKERYLDDVVEFIEQGQKPVLNVEKDGTVLGLSASELVGLTGLTPQQFVADINQEVGKLVQYKLDRDRRTGVAPVDSSFLSPALPTGGRTAAPSAADGYLERFVMQRAMGVPAGPPREAASRSRKSVVQRPPAQKSRTAQQPQSTSSPASATQRSPQFLKAGTAKIQQAIDAGQISQEDAIKLLGERESMQTKLEELNRQSSGAAALNSLMQRMVPANQGVVMRNLNG